MVGKKRPELVILLQKEVTMAEMEKYIIGILGLFTAVYAWLLRHLFVKAQFKDVCKANRDCIETKIDGLKELLEQRFDSLEELVKKNGREQG